MKRMPWFFPLALQVLVGGTVLLVVSCGSQRETHLKLSGNIEVIQVEASFRVAGKVLERPVDEGQVVQAGQLLARLDAKDLEQQVAMRRADTATARAILDALNGAGCSACAARLVAVRELRKYQGREAA